MGAVACYINMQYQNVASVACGELLVRGDVEIAYVINMSEERQRLDLLHDLVYPVISGDA